ncbi:VacJ family lipoprotein [Roseovarius autotrophicus]|uniref:MlaA family lipoprotein n=1 Tax=Roseovarius autotrophicus TaxID=2824121 RepID=UPI0019F4C089|nr:VacJ family lipoprotein [Roseovarius autotrophicus]MBE0455106.1 VacJ family lipoprotein [Roseovarius sp.]
MTLHSTTFASIRRYLGAAPLIAALFLSACAKPDEASRDIFDPFEAENRRMHDFNRGFDRSLLRPVAHAYAAAVPDDIETVIIRFAENLSLPADVVNNVLQLNMRAAIQDTARFVVNTTVGLGGFFDPASEMGMAAASNTDFGQTLHVWGAKEGAFIELPLLGPSTTRDTYGLFFDLFTNPLSYVIDSPENLAGTAAGVASGLSRRDRFSETIDQILYESADSYALSRSIFLQNRRFKLGGTGSDTYTDPYDTMSSGASVTPLEDPYDE